jgi:hypothetical protein
MMGRAKILWTHTRCIEMEASKSLYKYVIPVYSEKDIGSFVKSEIKDGYINLYYQRKIPAEVVEGDDKFKVSFTDRDATT